MSRFFKDKQGFIWEIHKDLLNEWRWRKISSDGEVVLDSFAGFEKRKDCIKNAEIHGHMNNVVKVKDQKLIIAFS